MRPIRSGPRTGRPWSSPRSGKEARTSMSPPPKAASPSASPPCPAQRPRWPSARTAASISPGTMPTSRARALTGSPEIRPCTRPPWTVPPPSSSHPSPYRPCPSVRTAPASMKTTRDTKIPCASTIPPQSPKTSGCIGPRPKKANSSRPTAASPSCPPTRVRTATPSSRPTATPSIS